MSVQSDFVKKLKIVNQGGGEPDLWMAITPIRNFFPYRVT